MYDDKNVIQILLLLHDVVFSHFPGSVTSDL